MRWRGTLMRRSVSNIGEDIQSTFSSLSPPSILSNPLPSLVPVPYSLAANQLLRSPIRLQSLYCLPNVLATLDRL